MSRSVPVCLALFLAVGVPGAMTAAQTGPAASAAAPATDYGKVGYAKLEGPIDRLRRRYLERVVADARAAHLDTLIVHLDTDGGAVADAREMFNEVIAQGPERGGPRMIAYVDFRAISAGALIAYAHSAVYLAQTASIGDIGVIFVKPDGEIAYAPEKIETVIRTLLALAAERNGWSRGLLTKMTARNQKLYRISPPGGEVHYVIEDDLADFLVRHPGIDREDPQQFIVYRGEDRLLTLSGTEAVRLGMGTGIADSVEALYRSLGIDPARVENLGPRSGETVAWLLSSIAPVLAGLALLFIIFELKTPGVGLWAMLGAVAAALFLFSHYSLDLINNLEVLLIGLGLALLILELMTGIGGGVLGLAGGAALLVGMLLAFTPDEFEFDPSDERFVAALAGAAWNVAIVVAVFTAGLLGLVRILPSSRLRDRLALRSEVTATSARDPAAGRALVGRRGTAREALRPSGTVSVDGRTYGARVRHGAYVAAGAEVEIVGEEFGDLVVAGCEREESAA